MTTDDPLERVHRAIQDYIASEGEIVTAWCLTAEVAGAGHGPWLAHRGGGGHDGHDGHNGPAPWTALGMLRASVGVAEQQLIDTTEDADDDEDD